MKSVKEKIVAELRTNLRGSIETFQPELFVELIADIEDMCAEARVAAKFLNDRAKS
jgi:hypothetical protein